MFSLHSFHSDFGGTASVCARLVFSQFWDGKGNDNVRADRDNNLVQNYKAAFQRWTSKIRIDYKLYWLKSTPVGMFNRSVSHHNLVLSQQSSLIFHHALHRFW